MFRAWGIIICTALLFAARGQAQTALINGGRQDGAIIVAGGTDSWTFTATNGDNIVLRLATLTASGPHGFGAYMRVYTPNSTLLLFSPAGGVDEIAFTATNTGTFTVLVADGASGNADGTGTYRFYYAKIPGSFTIPSDDDGGALPQSGGKQDGTIDLGDLDLWTFTATNGDNIVLRLVELTSSNSFRPDMRIYAPNGTLLYDVSAGFVGEAAFTAATNGTFTVLVDDGHGFPADGTGTYRFYYAKIPGSFVIPSGDDGGALPQSGGKQDGTIDLGDLDLWTFTATNGDNIVLRLVELASSNSFTPDMRIYAPNGTKLFDVDAAFVGEAAFTATTNGTFTVLVDDGHASPEDGTGTYRFYFAKMPGAFIVPSGDDGGAMTNGGSYNGTILLGDIDLWSFVANSNNPISLQITRLSNTNNFAPWIYLYGSTGNLLGNSGTSISRQATNSGTYVVLVDDGSGNEIGTGTYNLTVNGISGPAKFSGFSLSGTNLIFNGSGGGSNGVYIVLNSTNLALPAAQWTPLLTNKFSTNGVFNFTNGINILVPQKFYQLIVP